MVMTADEIIDEALVPNTKYVFVLGSFERRVTVYAQQVRALNLVDAILSRGLLQDTGSVAIVGGGAAGITAAVALARAANLKQLDLFERRSDVLELQHHSGRYLHPHFYDWPSASANNPDAGLPIMNWTAGSAGNVTETLRAQFDAARKDSYLTLYRDAEITELRPSSVSTVRVLGPGVHPLGKIYDVVILAIGFGLEAHLGGQTLSYWLPSQLTGAILTNEPNPMIFISGNGDGGLVDFQMAVFNAMEHAAICQMVMELDLGSALDELQRIEAEAWAAGGEALDLFVLYHNRVLPLVPQTVWQNIIAKLRPNVRLRLHTNEPMLLRRTTALHNRLATFLAIEADRIAGHDRVEVMTGVSFVGGVPSNGPIRLAGQAAFTPFQRFLRLGADSVPNLAPFADVLSTFPTKVRASAVRPESPKLTAAAKARFQAAVPGNLAAGLPQKVTAIPTSSAVNRVLLRIHNGNIEWHAEIPPENAEQFWVNKLPFVLHADLPAVDAGPIVAAMARIGLHASGFEIRTKDIHGWRSAMTSLCAARELPGPSLTSPCVVHEWSDAPDVPQKAAVAAGLLAESVHGALDGQVLCDLRAALHEILGPAGVEIGWPIEAELKNQLWARWEEWHAALLASANMRRRFLLLLATERDQDSLVETRLVRLGPKIVQLWLTKPVIFGLAFSVCSGHALTPVGAPPGNIGTNGITGHACGVAWIGGRDLGPALATRQKWKTGVVLLAQLKEAFRLIEGELRFDQTADDPPRIGTIALGEAPLVIGADEAFITALEGGELSVRNYLQSIFKWRSDAARAALEKEEANG